MASGVNVKMGVTGIADFKRDINTAKESLKTLDEQLKLCEKQFKATGDKEAYMREKSELLKVKLEEQKAIVEEAEAALKTMSDNGVSKASRAFQGMQRQLLSAKGEMLETQTQLDNLGSSAEEADKKTEDMNTELKNIGKQVSVQNVVDGIDKITAGLEKAAKKAVDLGKKLVKNVLGAGEWADDLKTEADRWEMSPEELQRMQKTADLIDTSAEAILSAQQKMNRTLSGDSGKKTLEETLGISLNGQSNTDLFWEVGEAIMNMGDAFDKEGAATQLFGRSWRELVPLFKAGREQYEEMNASWDVVSKEQLDALGKMDDEYKTLISNFETLKMTALSEFAEPMTQAMETMNGLMKEFTDWLSSEEGKADVNNVVQTVTDALKWIVENKDGVIKALEAIVAGWAGLKLTGGALKVYELIIGAKSLFGRGGGGSGSGADSGSSIVSKATDAAKTSVSMAGAGGGVAVVAPLAAMAAAGYAGYKMIDANLNDDSLNKIYGDNEGLDLLDRMSAKQLKMAKEYENMLADQTKQGTEELFDMRDRLQSSLEESGIELSEQAVSLLENIFDERAREMDVDGLVAKFDELLAAAITEGETMEEDAETIGENTSLGLANGINAKADVAVAAAQALAAAVSAAISAALQINSPSKVMMGLGEFVSEGFAEGIENGLDRVNDAVDSMAWRATSVPNRGAGTGGNRTIDVTLMIGPDKLTEVIVPLVDNSLGEEINLMRR